MSTPPTLPAGWYPNKDRSTLRYFDGTTWTDHTSPGEPVTTGNNTVDAVHKFLSSPDTQAKFSLARTIQQMVVGVIVVLVGTALVVFNSDLLLSMPMGVLFLVVFIGMGIFTTIANFRRFRKLRA